jgi:hypothetical protein
MVFGNLISEMVWNIWVPNGGGGGKREITDIWNTLLVDGGWWVVDELEPKQSRVDDGRDVEQRVS